MNSMTGFGAGTARVGAEEVSVELKSVNGRFCEARVRLPRELAALEADVVRIVKERLARGTVEVHVRRSSTASGVRAQVDAALLAELANALRDSAEAVGLDPRLTVADLARLDGVVRIVEREVSADDARAALLAALDDALLRLIEARRREGQALERDLRERLTTLETLSAALRAEAPQAVVQFRERLRARVAELASDVTIDPARLEQEVVLYADRSDISEELTRLSAHLVEFHRLLGETAPVGRQLDFLAQELHREVNTSGSKSQSLPLGRHIVQLKAEVERIREQVQNVE